MRKHHDILNTLSEEICCFSDGGGFVIHILICDDEQAFTEQLKQAIESLPTYNKRVMKIACVNDPHKLTQSMIRAADIIFLDIDMGDVNGMSFAKTIRSIRQNSVLIFVTNYGEYAAEGYEVNAFRFLPKLKLKTKLPIYFSQALAECKKRARIITIFCEGEDMPVNLDDLVFVKTDGRALAFYSSGSTTPSFRSRITLQSLEEQLSEQGFLRIHNSYLVNLEYVTSIQTKGVQLKTGETLPLSLHRYREIKEKYLEWKGAKKWSTY